MYSRHQLHPRISIQKRILTNVPTSNPFPLREVRPTRRIRYIAALLVPDAVATAATVTGAMEQRRLAVPVTELVDDKAPGAGAGTAVVTSFELWLAGAGDVLLAGGKVRGEGESEG